MSAPQQLLITIAATPNEVIALQMAIHYYVTYFHQPTEDYRATERLLQQFQARLIDQLPTMPMISLRMEHGQTR